MVLISILLLMMLIIVYSHTAICSCRWLTVIIWFIWSCSLHDLIIQFCTLKTPILIIGIVSVDLYFVTVIYDTSAIMMRWFNRLMLYFWLQNEVMFILRAQPRWWDEAIFWGLDWILKVAIDRCRRYAFFFDIAAFRDTSTTWFVINW